MSECGWHEFETEVDEDAAYLRDSSPERQLLFRLIEVYWGNRAVNMPPEFIERAAKLWGIIYLSPSPIWARFWT